MDLNYPALWGEDITRVMEVYQARGAYLISHPLLALLAYTVALLPRCGAADNDDKMQGFNAFAYTGRIVIGHRFGQR